MASLKLTHLCKSYGDVQVLRDVNLEIEKGEFIVFVGPSGCGKSTLLRSIAGLEDITSGSLEFDGRTVNALAPSERGVAMVFQSYALYPHMTVFDNMAFGLKLKRGRSRDEIRSRVEEAARILQVDSYLDRLPKQLAGGQRQRVAIGRAIVRKPSVFLFDEPLSNLDAALRVQTRLEIARLSESMSDTTMIYVTHDQVEAMTLADRIVVLRDGIVEQFGAPMELYDRPANLFVARFLGSPAMNVLPAKVKKARDGQLAIRMHGGRTPVLLPAGSGSAAAGDLQVGIRPEDLSVTSPEKAQLAGMLTYVEKLGELQLAYVELPGADELLIAKLGPRERLETGSEIALAAGPESLKLFDAAGKAVELAPAA